MCHNNIMSIFTQSNRHDIKALKSADLAAFLASLEQPPYRAQQIEHWLYSPGCMLSGFDEMTNLPQLLRTRLAETCTLSVPTVERRLLSSDGTRKYLLRFDDGSCVECVGIPEEHSSETNTNICSERLTVCVSSQVGCAMGCVFCATGHNGLRRSLVVGEIMDQLRIVYQDFRQDFGEDVRITNVVAMGQGEPFANYDAVLAAFRLMNNPRLWGIGARHLTVSTCGLLSAIRRFSTEPEQFTLAVSLHSAVQKTRDLLIPRLATQPLEKLYDVLLEYMAATGRRVSLEYILIHAINDTDEDLNALISFCSNKHHTKGSGMGRTGPGFHVNLIPLNDIDHLDWKPSTSLRVSAFKKGLQRAGIETSVRVSRGADIAGACGQLAGTK